MNNRIISQFELLVKLIQQQFTIAQADNNIEEMKMHSFRLKSVKRILNILRSIDEEIESIDQLKGITGIGKGTLDRISEIINQGYLSELEGFQDKPSGKKEAAISELQEVIGIGPELARELFNEYGIYTIQELKKAHKKGKINVDDQVRLGLKYHGLVQTKIPRQNITEFNKYLEKISKKIDPDLEIIICGSYRRGKATSGDVDILIYHPDAKTMEEVKSPGEYDIYSYLEIMINTLKKKGVILDDLTNRNYKMKYMGFMQYKDYPVWRIDVRWISHESLPTALLYFTGPYELNTIMRNEAKKKGMILNEYGLYKITNGKKKPHEINSEKDVFKKLGMNYLDPEQREYYNTGKVKPSLK